MTDEELQGLVKDLREASDMRVTYWARAKAAEEIERLAESLKAAHGYAGECEAKIRMHIDQINEMVEALEFYADPETYFAIGFFPDPPCGEFMDDFSDEHDPGHPKPGKRAREVLTSTPPHPDASAGLTEAAELDKMAGEVEDNLQYNDYNGQQYSAMRHRNREVIRKALSHAATGARND